MNIIMLSQYSLQAQLMPLYNVIFHMFYHHAHTVQVNCNMWYLHMCKVNARLVEINHHHVHSACSMQRVMVAYSCKSCVHVTKYANWYKKIAVQVAGDVHCKSRWGLGKKNTSSISYRQSRPLWAEVYRSRMEQPHAGIYSTRAKCASGNCVVAAPVLVLVPNLVLTFCD